MAGAEIVATYMQSGTYDKAAEGLVPVFAEDTGIDVELVVAPWDVLNQNHITDLTTGTGAYDVMSGEFWIANVFEHMLPLDEYVERDAYGDEYIEGIWSPGPSNFYDGKRIGVPYSADAYGIWYNTEVFEDCGVEAVWETWDDYIAVLEELAVCLEGTDISPMVHYFGQIEQPLRHVERRILREVRLHHIEFHRCDLLYICIGRHKDVFTPCDWNVACCA